MNAGCLFNGGSTDIKGVLDTWGQTQVIYVARRQTKLSQSSDEGARIFITGGSAKEYEGKEMPVHTDYIQDTGMGHKNKGWGLLIENVVECKDGEVVSSRNDIGLNERRRAWTFK
jgi:hypothetical protein